MSALRELRVEVENQEEKRVVFLSDGYETDNETKNIFGEYSSIAIHNVKGASIIQQSPVIDSDTFSQEV